MSPVMKSSGYVKNKMEIQRRVSQRVPSVLLDCDYCAKTFYLRIDLLAHLNMHIIKGHQPKNTSQSNGPNWNYAPIHNKIPTLFFDCNTCHKKFMTKAALSNHTKTHKTSTRERVRKPFVCDVCGLKFAEKSDADMHQFVHWNENKWSCARCGQSFGLETRLRNHERIHRWIDSQLLYSSSTNIQSNVLGTISINSSSEATAVPTEPCLIYANTVISVDTTINEMKSASHGMDNGVEGQIESNGKMVLRSMAKTKVNKVSKEMNKLKTSMKKEVPFKQFECYLCKKTIKGGSWKIRRHTITHTNEKPFACGHCGKKFNRKDKRNDHERRNTCK